MIRLVQGTQRTFSLTNSLNFGLKLTLPRSKPSQYAKEIVAYKKVLQEYRARNIQQYWTAQTKIENDYIEKFQEEGLKRKKQDDLKFLNSIIKNSRVTADRLQYNEKLTDVRNEKIKKHLVEEDIKKINRERILQVLRVESQNWVTAQNIDEKVSEEVLIPSSVYDETDYYLRLHQEALYYQEGAFDKLENLGSETEFTTFKNQLLIPKYQEVLSCIKHMKNNGISQLKKEFEVAKSLLMKESNTLSEQELQEKLQKLENAYNSLVTQASKELERPRNQLNYLHKQLYFLYNLLTEWREYTKILKYSNSVISELMKQDSLKYNPFGHDDVELQSMYFNKEAKIRNEPMTKKQQNIHEMNEALNTVEESETEKDEPNDEINLAELAKNKDEQNKQADVQQKEIESKIKQAINEVVVDSKAQKDQVINEESTLASQIDNIFKQHQNEEEKDEHRFEKEFEELKIKNMLKNKTLIGTQGKPADPRKLYQSLDLDSVFPQVLINSVNEFENHQLKYSSVDSIVENEITQNIREIRKGDTPATILKTNVIIEVYKDKLNDLKQNSKDLSRKDLNKLEEVNKLLYFVSSP